MSGRIEEAPKSSRRWNLTTSLPPSPLPANRNQTQQHQDSHKERGRPFNDKPILQEIDKSDNCKNCSDENQQPVEQDDKQSRNEVNSNNRCFPRLLCTAFGISVNLGADTTNFNLMACVRLHKVGTNAPHIYLASGVRTNIRTDTEFAVVFLPQSTTKLFFFNPLAVIFG